MHTLTHTHSSHYSIGLKPEGEKRWRSWGSHITVPDPGCGLHDVLNTEGKLQYASNAERNHVQ